MAIAIIDYGAGNLRSVEKAIESLGFEGVLTRDPKTIISASGIILPGVGSFDSAVSELRHLGIENQIQEMIGLNKPFLGICLGYQLLFESSEEGKLVGLSVFKGTVKKFGFNQTPGNKLPIPHMGWNRLLISQGSKLFYGIENGSMVYFAHSFYPAPEDPAIIAAKTDYGIEFASAIEKGNVFGIQFHPEKSGEIGLKILRNFCNICLK